jgi:putative ABC transport system permease protein
MSWLRRLANTVRPARLHRDIERELSFHIAERADQLHAQGLSREEATRRARIQFGNPVVQRERTREVDIAGWVDATVRNVRHSVRTLTRTPGFTVTVVLTLALGIGANTAVFSAIDMVLLRPLPFPEGDRLVLLTQTREGSGETRIAPVRLQDWNRMNATFEGIAGYYVDDVVDTRGELPQRFRRAFVTRGFFDVLRVIPAIGRGFMASEHSVAEPITMIISDRRWRSLGADPLMAGRTIKTPYTSLTTIGIMPASFQFPSKDVDIWSADDADASWAQSRALTWFTGIGRLRPGVTLAQAQADLDRVQAQLAQQYTSTDRGIGVRVTPLKDTVVGESRASLWLLFGSVSVLLLIACTNIAALLLSRAAKREQEIAVRYSLGGSRAAVVGQLLTEAGVLAVIGAVAGLGVALAASRAFRALAPELPRVNEIAIDGRILLYTIASTVVVALLCGLVPAWRGARGVRPFPRSARTQVSQRHSIQWLLVGVQVALSVTLLAGAGLLLRSVAALSRVDLGFDSRRVLTLHVSGTYGWETTDGTVQRINRVIDGIGALPGVESVAITSTLPGVRDEQQLQFELAEGRADSAPRMLAETRVISPAYFQTLRIPLLAGELCRRPPDAGGKAGVVTEVMVNRRFADLYLSEREVTGLHLTGGLDALFKNGHLFAAPPPARIVGVVGDARELGADRAPAPTVYTCFSAPDPAPWHVIRTSGDAMAMAATIRRKIHELEPQRSVYDVVPLDQRMGDAYAQNRLRTWLLTLFAMTALALVCAGVYGTLSYAVSLRRREVALRLALGALRRSVIHELMLTSVQIVGVAAACGLVLALLFTQSLATMLYGVTPADPATLTGVIVVVVTVALIAALIPAARATFVHPMRALREE